MGELGSTLWIDDIGLTYTSGIEEVMAPEVITTVGPNPANDKLEIKLSKPVNDATFSIHSMSGTEIISGQKILQEQTAELTDISSGKYIVSIYQKGKLLSTAKFVISR